MGATFEEAARAMEPWLAQRDTSAARGIAEALLSCDPAARGKLAEHARDAWGEGSPPLFLDDTEGELAVLVESKYGGLEGVVQVGSSLLKVELEEAAEELLSLDSPATAGGFRRQPGEPPARVFGRYFLHYVQIFAREQQALWELLVDEIWPDVTRDWEAQMGMLPLPEPDSPRISRALEPERLHSLGLSSPESSDFHATVTFLIAIPTRRGGFATAWCTVTGSERPDGVRWSHELFDLADLPDSMDDDW